MPRGNGYKVRGKNLRIVHFEYRQQILELLIEQGKPMCISDVVDEIGCAYPTATLILMELALEGKLNYTPIGTAKVFTANIKSVVEKLEAR